MLDRFADSSWEETTPAALFPQLSAAEVAFWPAPTAKAYGPQGQVVLTHLLRASRLKKSEISLVGSAWQHGRDVRAQERYEQPIRLALARTAEESGRQAAVREAYLAGQAAVLSAINPKFGQLEHWWYRGGPEVPAMDAAGYAAAALAVGDLPDADIRELVMSPWRILEGGYPPGYFGPRSQEAAALIEAIPGLTLAQCDHMVAVWRRVAIPELRYLPQAAFSRINEMIDQDARTERHLSEALMLAGGSLELPPIAGDYRPRYYATSAYNAIHAAMISTVVGDLLDPGIATDLGEAWAARDQPWVARNQSWWRHLLRLGQTRPR